MRPVGAARRAGVVMAGTVVGLAGACGWPQATIEIAPGGMATIDGRVLPETVLVPSRGRGTRVRVVNRDSVRHTLALFSAPAGETVEYTIEYPGTYGGDCSVHSKTGRLVWVVR